MDVTNILVLTLGGAFWLVLIIGLLHRLFRDRLSRQRTVKARIVRKRDSTGENFTVYGALGRPAHHLFSAGLYGGRKGSNL